MSETLEKIIFYILGGVSGAVMGMIIFSLDMPILEGKDMSLLLTISILVGILTAALLHEHEKEKKFRENTRIRNETVALITHEMRTGLTSTGWAMELVLQNYSDKLTDAHKKMLEDVLKSIHTTVMHSVNLLDISLLDIGKLSISLEWLPLSDLEKVFAETTEKYVFGAQRQGIKIISQIKLDPEKQVQVDMMRIRIILENLLENALQYTTGDKKEIIVNAHNDASWLHIAVKDTGIGIPPAEQEKIFGEFYRASNARKKLSSGSGIGLYICHQYVKAHNGAIRFESKENEGTTFFIALPLKTTANVNDFLKKI